MSDSKRYRITSVLDGNTESIEVDGARLTPEAYDKMRSRFGDNFHVEQMVPLNPGETISPDSEYEVTSMLDGNSESVVVNGSRLTPDVQKKMDERFKGDWSVSKAEPVDVQDSYAVMTGDRTMIWDKERYDRSFESFKAFHPDATAERRLIFSPHYSGLSPEKEYEDLSRRLSHEELSNGDFIREYEGNMKAAGLAAKSGTVLAENPYETYLSENRSRYESVRKDIEDMRMRLHANPVYQERRHSVGNALAAMRSGIRKEMDDYIAAHPDEETDLLRSKISAGIYRQTPIAPGLISPQSGSILFRYAREVERYGAAKRLMDDAVKLYNAPSRYGEENGFMNYLKGMGDTFSDIDFWTRGLTGIVDSMSLRPVLQDFQEKFGKADPDTISETDLDGMFSPAEKALLNAFAMNAYVQAERSGDLSLGYQAGQGTAESLGYMAEFILTGGVGNAASVPLKNALSKWLAKGISRMAPGIGKKAVKTAGKTAIGLLTDSFKMASMTGVMPSTYENIATALVEVTEEGKLPEVNRAAWNAGMDAAIENLSEIRGSKALSAFVGKMKKGLTRMVPDEFVRALSDNKVTKFLKAGGYDGLPEEFFEEWYGAGLRAITIDPDALRDFATVDSQIVMAASFIPITVGGGLVSGGRRLYLKKRFDRAQDNLRNALVKNGYSDSQTDYMISMVQNTSAQQISDTFTPIINTLGAEKATEGGAKSLLGAVADFARASLEYRTAESMQSVKDSEDRDSMKRDILQQTGGAQFWMDTRLRDGSTLPEVQIAATSDGRRFFVLGQASSEGEIPVMDEVGQKSFLRQDDIVQSSEAMPIDTYLSSRIMELKRDAEAQRLDSERSIQMEDLRKEAVPGKQINIGMEEAPVLATIQPSPGHTADEVIVIVDGETAPRALTWEEFGNYIGRPVSTRTDIEIDEAESAKIEQEQSVHDSELAEETLRIIPDGTEADVISPDIAVTAAEQNMPEEQSETQGYAIPMKSDGTVDENAFWNQNPGQWAIWNDAQRNDGGADTDIYIANAVELLESDITGLESAYARESDMDARHAIRSAIDGKRQRLGELQNLISRRSAERQGVPDSADANIRGQGPVPNDSILDRDTDAPQESEIPTDDKGRPQYHLAPLAASLADIYSQGLTQDEIDGFIEANISELQKELDKTRAKAPKIGTDLQAYRKAKADYEDAVASVQDRLDYWNRIKSAVDAVKVQSAAIQDGGSQEEAEVQIGRSLTKEEADALVASMERNAVPAPELELTPENWVSEFGEDGIVDTPIGKVRMGEHQYLKLARQGRNGKLGMIRPTLEMPDVVVETDSEAKTGDTADRASSYVFVRTFIKPDGSRYYYFTSVTVNKDGHEVVVSSQEKKPQRILRLLTDGSVIWRTPKDATTSSAEKQGLDYVQPQNAEAAAKGSGITPQSTSFDSKGSENPEESNTLQPEDESLIDAAVRTAQNRNTDIETTRTGRSAEEAPADTPVGGGSNTGALKVNDGVPLSEFATGVADDVYSKLPDNLKGRVSVRSSSDGNESGQSFIQRYDIDGKPSKVYFISLFGTDITTNPNYFAIEGYNVDNQEQWDEYSRLFDEYKKSHPDVRAFEHDETGALFDRFEDALDFSRFAEERMSDADSRFKRAEEALSGENFTDEEQEIVSKAIADGTYMEAPNGAKTNLSPKQWVQVRTKAFKEWFGDWEKAARIEKLRKSAPVEITGNEITPSDDLKQYKKNALEYGKKLRGEYTNNDTGITVIFSSGNKNGGLKEVLQHDVSSTAHIQSIAAIPQIIENAIYIDSVENEDKEKKPNVSRYHYYVCGLQIGGTDYTVKAVIAEQNNGDRYYDHKLTAIEKSNLIDRIDEISSSFTEDETAINQSPQSGLSSTGESGETKRSRPAANGEETIFSPVSDIKDKRLLSLLQTNSSKVVDENGEPRVVYHGTDADFTIFDRKMSGRKGDPGLRGKGFYLSPNRRTSESYGDNIINSFVNIKSPFVPFAFSSAKDIAERLNISENVFDFTPGSDFRVYGNFSGLFSDALKDAGYDGVLYLPRQEIVVFNPNQIKSSIDNIGTFSSENDDIRYRRTDDVSEFSGKYNLNESDVADYADAMVRGNLNGAARAFHEIRRKIRLDNDGASLGEFVKIFSPIEKELYAKFGNIDDLRQQYVQRTLDERNAMEAARRRAEEAEEVERVRLQEFRAMDSGQLDMEYMRAVEANDESRMRDLVNEAARRNGYGDVASEYQGVGAWSAPSNPGYASDEERRNALQESGTDINVADIAAGYSSQPDDYFTNLRAYGNDTPYGRESADAINDAIENLRNGNSPMIKVYRAVPKSVKEGKMRNGDWVTPSRKYAQMHGENRLEGDYRIIEQEVSADQLWWDGNDINEWGYDDGGSYAYRNTRNNRKLNDLITRDDKGNIIPLSKRFNARKSDIRFRFIGEKGAARLDAAEEATTRLDNLRVAREMENGKKDARNIKLATGWERGADGKWRYETPDFTFNEKPVVVDFDGYSLTTLGELLNDKGLFNAYPELEDMMVQYQDLPLGRLGQYSPKGMFPAMITLDRSFMERRENPEWRKRKEEMEQNPIIKAWDEAMEAGDLEAMEQAEAAFKTSPLWNEYNELLMGKGDVPRYIKGFSGESELAHEIQHVIQDIEGFARGSSPDNFRNVATSENVIADIVAATDGKLLEEGGFDNTPQGIFNALDKKTTYGTVLRDYGNALDAVAEKYGYETIFDLVNDIDKFKSSVQMYRAVSGEVEARNVERRMNLTPEERLLSLATETEDVAREDQIVLMDALGGASELAGSRQDIAEVNRKFNEQLGQQIDGTLAKGHIYQLGMPSDVLLSTGIPDLPIELSSTRLAEKAGQRNHEFDISDVKGLPEALQSPLAVFSYGDKDKAQNVIVEIERDGKNFVVGLHLNQNRRGIDINDIRGIFPKDNAEWLNWISQGKLLYADKVKIQTLIDKQRTNLAEVEYLDLDSIANVLNNFENPKLPARNPMPAALEAIREDRRIREDNSHVRQPMEGTLQNMRSAADTAANALGVEVNYISRDEMPRDSNGVQQRYAKGYQRAGSIYVCLENHSSEEDVMMTVMHEAVGHKGLRALVGTQNMDRFCMAVFSAADKKVREDIFALSYKYDMHIGEAVEEYLAGLAEKGEFTQDERSFFRKVVDALMELLDRIGIHFDRPFSVADAKYLLWQSYHALDGNDMFIQARRTALANRLGFLPRQEAEETHASLRMRRAVPDSAATLSAESSYSRAVASAWNRLRETFVDMYAPLESLVKSIEAASGKTASAWENVMQHIYSVGSINQADKQVFQIRFMEPLWNAVKKLADKSDAGFDGIIRYVMLKHGLERNEKFARRDAEAHYRDEHRSITDNLRKGYAKRSAEEKAKVDAEILSADSELARHLSDIESGTDPLYLENRNKDYSGIISMFSEYDWKEGESPERREYESQAEYNRRCAAARRPKYEDLADAEAAAREEIQEVEGKAAEESAALWDRMRSATGYILDHQLNAGTISRQTYDHLSGMFEYYVPLRGFAEDTAEDLYEYFNRSSSNDFSPPLAKAKGRRSVADNPFAQLGVMAESAIQQDNKNRAKLAMYYFILGRPGNDAVTVSSPWYVLEGIDSSGRKIWRETVPDFSSVKEGDDSESIGRIISAFDARMEALQKSGQAYRGRRRMDLGDTVVHISGASANEHIVPVMVNGERVNMILNSDPRAAQSLNGLLNIESDDDVISGFAGTITRWMANNFTSRNPEFWISNLQRDLLFSLMNVSIKEDVAYRKAFRRNLLQGFRTVAYTRRFRKDSLGDSQYEKYYREFVENGGVTGYTRLASAEEYLGMMEKYMKRDQEKKVVKVVRGCFDGLRDFSESIENVTRFAAYMTSREQGRPVSRAIMDAKNVSVNFNRKGSGKAISWKESARLTDSKGKRLTVPQRVFVCALSAVAPYARRWVAFFNAAVQSLSLNVSLAKNNPRRYAAWMSGCVALGMLNAMIHALLDDDDDYLDMPEWERRQNLLVGGGGYYMKWNIPQEARPFYALGDILVNWSLGRMKHQNIFFEAIESLGEIAPPVVPTPLQPVWELAMNKDYAGAPIYRDMPWDKDNPAYLRTYRGTNQILIDLSELMNSATGGDYATEGAIGNGWWVNPGVWEHFIDGLTGGTGQFIRRVSNVPFMAWDAAVNGEGWSWHDTPLTNRVFVRNEERSRNSYLNGVYWYYKDISDSIERREKRYRKAHDSAKINSLRSSPEYSIMRIFQKYSDRLEHYDDLIREETDESRRRDILRRKDDYVLRPMVDELVAADI